MALCAIPERLSSELSAIRALAVELSRARREPASTLHLLAALVSAPGPVADLLGERKVTKERLLASGAPHNDGKSVTLDRCFTRATELARRMGLTDAGSAHLLMALLADNGSVARRTLDSFGLDLARLRSSAWNVGLGYTSRKRAPTAEATVSQLPTKSTSEIPSSLPSPNRKRLAPGIAIPLVPPPSESRKKKLGPAQTLSIIPERPVKPSGAPEPTTQQASVVSSTSEICEAPPTTTASDEPHRKTLRQSPKRGQRSIERFELDLKRFPILAGFGRNLTSEALQGKLDPVVGRDREMDQTLDVLAKRHANSPCLVGPSGVGKTSIVRGLAQRIAARERTHALDERIVVEIPVSELIAGTGVRGALAQRISALRQEVKQADGRVVVFFDEIHLLFSGDAADESAGELKLALSRGEFPCIGATTSDDYRKSIENDPALARRFSAIDVEEPTREDAYLALFSMARKLETHHLVKYNEDALALAVNWSIRYLPGRQLPDKAISMIDLAGARAHRRAQSTVTAEHIAEVVADMALIPVERLLETDAERFLSLERVVAERVVGHEPHIRKICSILRRNAAGLGSERPIGTFLLLGPTGVGKTETAKAIAHALFHSETAMVRIDMAEYSEPHTVARLIGAPPGYVGHDAGGQLTEAIRKRPYQVLLLDEIEKAHPDVLQSFLAVFDEGRLTDGKGRTVDFRNTVILLTSNLGAEHTSTKQKRRVGFGQQQEGGEDELEERVISSARARLSPELYNRLDEALVYSALSRSEIHEIARRLLAKLGRTLLARGTSFEVSERAIEHLIEQGGFDAFLGARPMKRTISRLIEAPLADMLLSGGVGQNQTLFVDVLEQKIAFEVRKTEPKN